MALTVRRLDALVRRAIRDNNEIFLFDLSLFMSRQGIAPVYPVRNLPAVRTTAIISADMVSIVTDRHPDYVEYDFIPKKR